MKNLLLTLISLMTIMTNAQKLKPGDAIPEFVYQDVYENPISLETMKGKNTALIFLRNAGCPVCNLHVHELLGCLHQIRKENVSIILVYESSKENLLAYLNEEDYPFTFVADPQGFLYTKFNIDHSFGKLMKANFHGAMGKMKKGKKLFKEKPKQDGRLTTVGAEFLISKEGILVKSHYGDYVGDHMNAEEIIAVFKEYNQPITVERPAKNFHAKTIEEEPFELTSLKGKKILLTFLRNGACALCNLRVHELIESYDDFKKSNIEIVAIFESSVADMKPYVGKQQVPFYLLSDPSGRLFEMYGVQNSPEIISQIMSSGSAVDRVKEAAEAGFNLTEQPGSNFFRIPADILIDEDFNITKIHHCQELINHLPIEDILHSNLVKLSHN